MNTLIKGLRNVILTGWGLSFVYFWLLADSNLLLAHLLFVSVLGGIASTFAMVFYVLPIHLLLSRIRLTRLRYYLIISLMPSIICIFIPNFTDATGRLMIESIITYAALGVILVTVFWLTACYRKPNNLSYK